MSHSSYISPFSLCAHSFSADIFCMENNNKSLIKRFIDLTERCCIKPCADNSKKIFLLIFIFLALESGIKGLPFIEFWRQFGKSLGIFLLSWSLCLALLLLVRKALPRFIRFFYSVAFFVCEMKIIYNIAITLRYRYHSVQSIAFFGLFVAILTLFELHFREKESD